MSDFPSFFDYLVKPRKSSNISNAALPKGSEQASKGDIQIGHSSSLSLSESQNTGTATGEEEPASGGPVNGAVITQQHYTFNVSDTEGSGFPYPRCTPIAVCGSLDAPQSSGSLIAATARYICYPIKSVNIRVIAHKAVCQNGQSVSRTLLKGHSSPISDLAFANPESSVIASLDISGSLYVWLVTEALQQLGAAILLVLERINVHRLAWHPTKANNIVLAQNGEVALVNIQTLIERNGGSMDPSPGQPPIFIGATSFDDISPDWRFSAHNTRLVDLSYSRDGAYLITAGADGWARVWDVEARNAVARWQPYSGAPLSRAFFLQRSGGSAAGEKLFVVTGGKQNSEIKVWRAWRSLAPVNVQTLILDDSDGKGRAFHLEVDDTDDLLLLADSLRPHLYALHVTKGPSQARIDRLTPFQLKHPVLSLFPTPGTAMDPHEGQADRSGAKEIQLYCLQTLAIQIYHIKPEDCFPPFRPTRLPFSDLLDLAATAAKTGTLPASEARNYEADEDLALDTEGSSPTAAHSAPSAEQTPFMKMLLQATEVAQVTHTDASRTHSAMAAHTQSNANPAVAQSPSRREHLVTRAGHKRAIGPSGIATESPGKGAPTSKAIDTSRATGRHASTLSPGRRVEEASAASPALLARDGRDRGSPQNSNDTSPATLRIMSKTKTEEPGTAVRLKIIEEKIDRLTKERNDVVQKWLSTSAKQAVTEAVISVGPTISSKVEEAVKVCMADVPVQLAANVGAAVKEPIGASFRQCFQEQLIPAVQSTTQRMFAQMNEYLSKNLTAKSNTTSSSPGATELRTGLTEVRIHVQSLASAVTSLATQLEGLHDKLDGMSLVGNGSAANAPAADHAGSSAVSQLKERLIGMLRTSNFDEAFQQALQQGDLNIVIWLCLHAPRDDIFDADPPLINPMIMLCLMQQLSFNLTQDTKLKLQWLKQLILAFDPQDPLVREHVKPIVAQFKAHLEAAAPEVTAFGDQESVRDLKFITRGVQKLH